MENQEANENRIKELVIKIKDLEAQICDNKIAQMQVQYLLDQKSYEIIREINEELGADGKKKFSNEQLRKSELDFRLAGHELTRTFREYEQTIAKLQAGLRGFMVEFDALKLLIQLRITILGKL